MGNNRCFSLLLEVSFVFLNCVFNIVRRRFIVMFFFSNLLPLLGFNKVDVNSVLSSGEQQYAMITKACFSGLVLPRSNT